MIEFNKTDHMLLSYKNRPSKIQMSRNLEAMLSCDLDNKSWSVKNDDDTKDKQFLPS